ncbi:MAG: TonB-dependent siderophore receptor [Calothrix sp. C42_A2020_038]|nr:TonB-dependent siderophore receptor [Calothrix sp. C42_A2020_038]
MKAQPLEGITEISVTNVDANTVRVTVIGEKTLPTVELFDDSDGLIFGVAPATTTTQVPQQPEAPPKTEAQEPTSEKPQDPAQADDPIELVVTGEADGYRVPDATTGTRTDTPLRDIPFSVKVVPRQVLEDQKVQRVTDALRNVAGVGADQSSRSAFDVYTIRGIPGRFFNNNIIINGLRDGYTFTAVDVANIEQIEVLKGPGAALFGQGQLGGTINVTTKQPLNTPAYSVEANFGNFNTYSGSIDLTGPLDENKNILYRFNAYGFSSDTFVDFFNTTRYSFAPALSIRLGENTKLTLEGQHTVIEQPNDRGLPARGTVLPNRNGEIPINRFLNEPSVDFTKIEVSRIGYQFDHRFSDSWQVRNAFRATFYNQPQSSGFPSALLEDERTLERGIFEVNKQYGSSYILDTNVVGNFKTGTIEHKLLIGFDLYKFTYSNSSASVEIAPIDIFNPVYSRNLVGARTAEFPLSSTINEALGIYIQDQISLSNNFKLLLGGRFDIVNEKQENDIGETTAFQQDEAFSPRIGIVYQPIPPISLYASYGRAFQQSVGSGLDRRLFKPERGTQYEIGVKADLSDRLSATLAYYNLTRSNVLVTDPVDPNFSIQTGEQKSQGVEFDIAGEILPGWKIIASSAYTNAEITKDPNFSGNIINNVPEFSASLWTTYEIPKGYLQGLGFGFGLFYVGERQGDLGNTFSLPSYVRTDAALFYKRNNFRASVNIKNLFDIRYFETAESDLRVFPGDPLTVLGSISWTF